MKYILFMCSGQSGHTALAHVLDGHRNIIIGEEIGCFIKCVKRGWNDEKIIEAVKKSSSQVKRNIRQYGTKERAFGSWRHRLGTVSKWTGAAKDLQVVGDKIGWDMVKFYAPKRDAVASGQITQELYDGLDPINKFIRRTGFEVKILHCIRNPMDHVSSWYLGRKESRKKSAITLRQAIERLDSENDIFKTVYDKNSDIIYRVYLESLINSTRPEMHRVMQFLDLAPSHAYLDGCERVLFSEPREKRHSVNWSDEDIRYLKEVMGRYEWYSYYKERDLCLKNS